MSWPRSSRPDRCQISYWYAPIVVSAQRLGCRLLWSEDLQDGAVYGDVTVRNPFAQADFVQEHGGKYAETVPSAGRISRAHSPRQAKDGRIGRP